MFNGPDGDLKANMTGADPHDTDDRSPIKQRQCPKVSVVRQDDPPEAVRLVQKFAVRPATPSLLFDIQNIEPLGA